MTPLTIGVVISPGDEHQLAIAVLESLISQTDRNFCTKIFINGQVDKEAFSDYVKVLRAVVVESPEVLPFAEALNTLLATLDNSEVFVRCDPDDVCLPSRIERLRSVFDTLTDRKAIVYSKAYQDTGRVEPEERAQLNAGEYFASGGLGNPIVHSTVAYYASEILAIGGYPTFRKAQDLALWIKCHVSGFSFIEIDEPLVVFRLPEDSKSSRGLRYLRSELEIYLYAQELGYCSTRQLIIQSAKRIITRMVLNFIPRKFYWFLIDEIIKRSKHKL